MVLTKQVQGVAKKGLEQPLNLLQPFGPLHIPRAHTRHLIQGQHPQEDVIGLFQDKQHELIEDCTAGNLHGLMHLLFCVAEMTGQSIGLHAPSP